jgi:L-seryl-tRNA(Ser) seleniumtransferase
MNMEPTNASHLSLLPAVDALLGDPRLEDFEAEPRPLVRSWARQAIETLRAEIRAELWLPETREQALTRAVALVRDRSQPRFQLRMRPVWNATGILLHTNLGRAVLPAPARRALLLAASGYSALEMDPVTGRRSSRLAAIRELVPLLTGAEAGFAVNNNAAALFLTIAALAAGREVVVSRGQLVEIGGSFRLPDILEAAGARLREVGTTNRTRIDDFARACGPDTALILSVHRSNFEIVGFFEEPSREELVELAGRVKVPMVEDIGSGALRAYRDLFPGEPIVEEALEARVDVVCMSADKLLGLTQAGIVAGRRDLIERIQRHPIARVVRLDKSLLASLEAGLQIHLKGPEAARSSVPLLRALSRPEESVRAAAERCAGQLRARLGAEYAVTVTSTVGEIGGGSVPGARVASWAVALEGGGLAADAIAQKLRDGDPPVVGRIQDGRILLDLRAIEEEEEEPFSETVARALSPEAVR